MDFFILARFEKVGSKQSAVGKTLALVETLTCGWDLGGVVNGQWSIVNGHWGILCCET